MLTDDHVGALANAIKIQRGTLKLPQPSGEVTDDDKLCAERYRYLRGRMCFTGQKPVATMTLAARLPAPHHDFHTDWKGERFDASVDATVDAARAGNSREL
ncbi:hypothetical protein WJ92_02590 [Burkholderia ubonensis]|nr:hypothetical protein WJ92_02590 [Burkholderia ubonensis]